MKDTSDGKSGRKILFSDNFIIPNNWKCYFFAIYISRTPATLFDIKNYVTLNQKYFVSLWPVFQCRFVYCNSLFTVAVRLTLLVGNENSLNPS